MANIIRWDPYREMARMDRLMDRWFENLPGMWRGEFDGEGYFPLDLYETDEAIVAKATLPGVRPEDVEITITGETLTIRGESKARGRGEEAELLPAGVVARQLRPLHRAAVAGGGGQGGGGLREWRPEADDTEGGGRQAEDNQGDSARDDREQEVGRCRAIDSEA